MRPVRFERNYIKNPSGSCLVSFGDTQVLCTCTIEEGIPPFIQKGGWLTAEYAMLPASVSRGRKRRDGIKKDGRSVEIQRLIGRSLRAAVNLPLLPEVTLTVDCDVIQADGGTRTAAISGGWVALSDALTKLAGDNQSQKDKWLNGQVAAVSVGICGGEIICDLDYQRDCCAEVDMNVVVLNSDYVEIQGTGEHGTFSPAELNQLLKAAEDGLSVIKSAQTAALENR